MAEARSVQLRVRELTRPGGHRSQPVQFAAVTKPGIAERLVAIVTIFILEFELPNTWLRNQDDAVRGDLELGGDAQILILFLALYALSFTRLVNNGTLLLDLIRRDRLLTVFLAWLSISSLWSAEPDVTVRRAAALVLTTGFAAYLVIRFSLRQIVELTAIAFAIGTALSVMFIVALPEYGVSRSGWIGVFVNKNLLGRHEVLAFLVYLIASGAVPRWRMLFRALAVVSAVLVVGSESATSMVGLLAAGGNYFVFRLFRARKTLFGAVAASFAGSAVGAVGLAYTNLAFVTALFGKDVTFTGRTELWERSLSAVAERPLFGWGWDAYWRGYFSPSHELWVQLPWLPPHAHNAFIDYLLVLGVPGAMLFAALLARGVTRAARYVRDRSDAIGLFPLMMLTYGFLFSLTEAGIVGRQMRWVLFVVSLLAIGPVGRRTQRSTAVEPAGRSATA